MLQNKGYKAYKKHWENQANLMEKTPWNKDKILKLTISTDYDYNLKELQFSTHSLKKENGKQVLRLKVPYNYNELNNFELQTLKLLGINENWLTDISIIRSHCSHH